VHEAFASYPRNGTNGFQALAIANNITGEGSMEFGDGSHGVPYIISQVCPVSMSSFFNHCNPSPTFPLLLFSLIIYYKGSRRRLYKANNITPRAQPQQNAATASGILPSAQNATTAIRSTAMAARCLVNASLDFLMAMVPVVRLRFLQTPHTSFLPLPLLPLPALLRPRPSLRLPP
jgi:hypothetical protein